ncbi:ABC transporter permease [Bowmanella sp. JS7-9]|uniref:ABC transporter permease n=1 Tax=Pseudobowmanella zhangzhouensis TaxID=1537679 RepID=A0ABW1XMW2_9ALTE|nr:FtsX-like permease family protein [Bowmanella sp. JS7-9]TBX22137.1 cell division protein FtsX [Bowmanella sp. JS7-9]
MWANLALRLFRHEMRRGELNIILAAIVLSVAAVLSLSLFSARLQSALNDKTAEFIAGDRQLSSRQVIDPAWLQKARELELNIAEQISTQSMLFANGDLVLADIRAVDSAYPLKGSVKISEQAFSAGREVTELPPENQVWMDARLFQLLNIEPGAEVEIGDGTFIASRVLSDIPDRGFAVFGNDQLVLMRLEDIAKTGVTGPGARLSYRYFFTGRDADLDAFYQWLRPQLNRELHRWRSVKDDESAIGNAVQTAERYFLLAIMLAVVLAAVSIAVAAQRYSQRHFDPVAIMKTLGASKRLIQKVYVLQILFVTMLGIVLGCVLGFVLQHGVVMLVSDRVPVSLDTWYWQPVGIAVLTGFICALLFSLYPLMQLFGIPPLRVLRRDIEGSGTKRLVQYVAAGGAIFALMWLYSGNLQISGILFLTGALLVIALFAVSVGLIHIGRLLGSGNIGAWQLAWARIQRRAMNNSVQLISFSVTLLLLLVVLALRNDMIKQWREQLPQGTPNYFLANITATQLPVLKQQFTDFTVNAGEIYPLIRGRLTEIAGEKVQSAVTKENEQPAEARRPGLGREANLTWASNVQAGNKVVAGTFFGDDVGDYPEVSVEQKIAERLRITMGDILTFDIGGQTLQAKVTSLREVNWQTMQPNFFFVLQPAAMQDFPATYITSFHLDGERKQALASLLAPLSSVTLIDVDARINQLRQIIDQVSLAVEFILVLVLSAGSLVLIAQVQASMDERRQELAILRTLGARGGLIRWSVVLEFLIIGLVAGLMAALAHEIALYFLQTEVFNMSASWHFEYWLIAPLVGAAVVGVLGAVSCWQLLRINTGQLLRNML